MTVHEPICTDDGDLTLALHGSFLPQPSANLFPPLEVMAEHDRPGAILPADGQITINQGRARIVLRVTNDGDRPIQVHFFALKLAC